MALIAFLALALAAVAGALRQAHHLDFCDSKPDGAGVARFVLCQPVQQRSLYNGKKDFNWEPPLTDLVWLTSIVSILTTFAASKLLLGDFHDAAGAALPNLWWVLAGIISCGTLAGALIMEFTKIFVSTKSRHVQRNGHLPPATAARR